VHRGRHLVQMERLASEVGCYSWRSDYYPIIAQ